MMNNTDIIDCGVCRFQSDGRISLASIMKKHKIDSYQEIHVFIKPEKD